MIAPWKGRSSGATWQAQTFFYDREKAGSGRLTIVVPKMDEARRSLQGVGAKLTGETEGDYGRIAQLADSDENRITLAEPPSKPFDS